MKTSGLFSLNYRDLLKGFIVAILSSFITILDSSLKAGSISLNWKATGLTALSAGIGYLLKNFLTDSKVVLSNNNPTSWNQKD